MKNFLTKLRQVSIGVTPIVFLIIFVQFFTGFMPADLLWPFIISSVLLVFGQALFLVGVDSSIIEMGELVGSNIRKLKRLWLILVFGLMFGTFATVAEPAVTVVSNLVNKVNADINPILLTWIVSSGIGIFVAYGLFRLFKNISIKWSFAISYILTFILIFLTPNEFRAIAFDFSGATTGVITVPFILSLGTGVAAVLGRKESGDSYGMIGLASIGPIITMCIMGIIFGHGDIGTMPPQTNPGFWVISLNSIKNILIALSPITVVFFLFNFLFIKLPKRKVFKILYGLFITVCGLVLFLTAINFGFTSAGEFIGNAFTIHNAAWFKYMLIPFGFVLGFAIALSEVAIRVLAMQIEKTTNGQIKKNTIIFTLALGLAVTVMFGMLRILFQINIMWFLVPIFAFGIICMPFVSKMFVGIAFDSGGVASGTITASFMVPFALGAIDGMGGSVNPMIYGFGIIAFIAAIPIVAISVLGLIYAMKIKKAEKLAAIAQKTFPDNLLLGIIVNPKLEQAISEMLETFNVILLSSLATQQMLSKNPDTPFQLEKQQNLFIMGIVSNHMVEAVFDTLEDRFDFVSPNTGIAFTIPIE